MDEYKTINNKASAEFEVNRSVFICNIKNVITIEEGLAFVNEITKKYGGATHNCYGIILKDGGQKISDDGEPQGTAGLPIAQVLKMRNIFDAAAVVTRYYGGIKLGANGLVGAYTKACADALDSAEISNMCLSCLYEMQLNYTEFSVLNNFIKDKKIKIVDINYSDIVTIKVSVADNIVTVLENKISEITAGREKMKLLKKATYYSY